MNTSAPLTSAHLSTFLGKKVKATINISDPKQYMLAMRYFHAYKNQLCKP